MVGKYEVVTLCGSTGFKEERFGVKTKKKCWMTCTKDK